MFVDCQNFAGSWECYFVGKWFAALQCNLSHYFVKRGDVNSGVRVIRENREH